MLPVHVFSVNAYTLLYGMLQESSNATKVCLAADSESELLAVRDQARKAGMSIVHSQQCAWLRVLHNMLQSLSILVLLAASVHL